MPWAAAGAAVGGIASGLLSSNAASKAAGQQANAEYAAINTQSQQNALTQAGLNPFKVVGTTANDALANLYGLNVNTNGYQTPDQTTPQGQALTLLEGLSGISPNGPGQANTAFNNAFAAYQNSPTYQFQLQQGQQALDRSAASKGLLLSGAQLKDSQAFGQGLASQGLGTFTQNLSNLYSGLVGGLNGLAGTGLNAAAGQGSANTATAGAIGQYLGNAGTAQAAGTIGSTSALNQGFSNAYGALTANPSSYGGGSGSLGGKIGGVIGDGLNYLYNKVTGGGSDPWGGAGAETGTIPSGSDSAFALGG